MFGGGNQVKRFGDTTTMKRDRSHLKKKILVPRKERGICDKSKRDQVESPRGIRTLLWFRYVE